jgi:hypothetical protein
MMKQPYRYLVALPPDATIILIRAAYENQHQDGVEIEPGWIHHSQMMMVSIKGNKMELCSSRVQSHAGTAILYAEILDHENGSEIIGEFRMNPSIRFFVEFARFFISFLLLGPVVILLLAKYQDPQALPIGGLTATIVALLCIHFSLMFGLKKLLVMRQVDVRLVHAFIEKATSPSCVQELSHQSFDVSSDKVFS